MLAGAGWTQDLVRGNWPCNTYDVANKKSRLVIVPALSAIFIVLLLTVGRARFASDLGVGMGVGFLLGISVLALVLLTKDAIS